MGSSAAKDQFRIHVATVRARRRAGISATTQMSVSRWRLSRTREARRGGGARGLAGQPQLRVDVREVALHRAGAQEQPLRDLVVAHPSGHQLDYFALALAQV